MKILNIFQSISMCWWQFILFFNNNNHGWILLKLNTHSHLLLFLVYYALKGFELKLFFCVKYFSSKFVNEIFLYTCGKYYKKKDKTLNTVAPTLLFLICIWLCLSIFVYLLLCFFVVSFVPSFFECFFFSTHRIRKEKKSVENKTKTRTKNSFNSNK